MANEGMLLRLLEPVVRPDGLPSSGSKPQAVPFDQRSFNSFLNEAKQLDMMGNEQTNEAVNLNAQKANSLGALSSLDRVENATLRMMLNSTNQPKNTTT